MRETLLSLLSIHEARIEAVEALCDMASRGMWASNGELSDVLRERDDIKDKLRTVLARGCSLRKKDFESIMDRIVCPLEQKRTVVEVEQRAVEDLLRRHLRQERERTARMRAMVVEPRGTQSQESLQSLRGRLDSDTQRVLARFRALDRQVSDFLSEQRTLNLELRTLLELEASLTLQHVKALCQDHPAAARQTARRARKRELEELLRHYRNRRKNLRSEGRSHESC